MRIALVILLTGVASLAHAELNSINPAVKKVVDSVSEERIGQILKKLESFHTRNIFSEQDNPERGIGAARHWIYDQMKSYSPRLEVSFDTYKVKKRGRIVHDVELQNVVAVLPGKLNKDHHIIISGHYDSVALNRPTGAPPAGSTDDPAGGGAGAGGGTNGGSGSDANRNVDPVEYDKRMSEQKAPGVTDDGSGTAAVMELARVMSQYEWDNTIVFIAFTAEEEGLIGSALYARKAHKENEIIDAVLNNDIIGSEVSGDGRINNSSLLIFSDDPSDSPSRELARYIKKIGERYVPSMSVDLIFRQDRFGRGGDHISFNQEGYAAVRFTTPNENFANQHTVTDTFENTSVSYTARVIQVNGAVAASLALAPKAPIVTEPITRQGRTVITPMVTRGKTRYDAQLKWKNPNPEEDLAGYIVTVRATTSPYWEREIYVGNVTEYLMKDVPIDEFVFGIKAVDKDGNESLAAVYTTVPRQRLEIETY
ncbi:MAG TPA: M28 family peptidase [Bryobacteraceae bacterium]|nr:M28 family peptidase [Bryobacteraceae bacterium]